MNMAQKRTKKAAPKKSGARKTSKKKTVKRKARRSWSPEKKAEIVAYAHDHGVEAACKEYRVVESSLYRWRRTPPKSTKRKARVSNGSELVQKLTQDNAALRHELIRLRDRDKKLSAAVVDAVLAAHG